MRLTQLSLSKLLFNIFFFDISHQKPSLVFGGRFFICYCVVVCVVAFTVVKLF